MSGGLLRMSCHYDGAALSRAHSQAIVVVIFAVASLISSIRYVHERPGCDGAIMRKRRSRQKE